MVGHHLTTLHLGMRAKRHGGRPLARAGGLAMLACLLAALGGGPPAAGRQPSGTGDPFLQTVWTTEEGLPQNSVNAILQTRDGYLWLGTFGGLVRFDGVRFTTFNTGNTPGLESNRILSLFEGDSGTLWMGAEGGEVMSFRDGAGRTFTTEDGLPGGHVWAVREDRAGTLWAGTANGLARLQVDRFRVYTTADGLPGGQIWAIDEDKDGSLWLATDGGLVESDGSTFTTYRPPGGLPENLFVPFSPRRAGGYWMGTAGGLEHVVGGRFSPHPDPHRTPAWKMRAVMEDGDGAVWVSYYAPSMVRRYEDGRFSTYELKSAPGVVRAMCEDREGNLWMGSDGGGLIRLKKRKVTAYTTEDGLPGDLVRAITDDGEGGVWIATSSGLARVRPGAVTVYTDRDGLMSPDLLGLCRDRAGSLWVGSNYGLTQLSGGRFVNYTPAEGLADPNVYAIAEDREGALWVGTGGGLHRLRDGRFTVWRQADGLGHYDVRSITQARDGALWLGTVGGLSRFKDGAFTNYTTRDGLSNAFVRAVFEEPDGTLWLGTYGGGLNRLKDGRFTAVTTANGLFDDFISCIIDDASGYVWLLGNRGIFKVGLRELNDFADGLARSVTSVSFGIADGMRSSEGNGGAQPAGWRAADGKLWFATIKGAVALDPTPANSLPPPVVIEQVTLDGEPIPTSGVVRITPGRENLEIHYTGLSLSRPEQVKFKYQLVGLDQEWVDAGTRRTAYYSHPPPGDYTFRVIADNGDGVWSPEGAALRIAVVPPFYRTWWFVTLGALGVAGALAAGHRIRISRLKRAQAAQQAFSRQLIASQETERKRIASELHDSLGQHLLIIKNRAALGVSLAEGCEPARAQLDEINASALLAINEVRAIAYNLRPLHLDRLGLTAVVEEMIEKVASASGIQFSCDIAPLDGLFSQEGQINFYRIVQESLNNIVKHAQATRANVEIWREGDYVNVTVRDDGRGFAPEAPANGDGGPSPRGLGLTGISERVRMLGGAYTIESAPGQGTTISLRIPVPASPGAVKP
jgi:signal transduction histidine kinase/ligand-binding sensor domain-containing protein